MLKEACLSQLGEKLVDSIHFSDDFEILNKLISQTEEFRQILLIEDVFPSQNYIDLTSELLRLNVEGTYIEIENLIDLKSSLTTISDCILFIKKLDENKYEFLKELIENVEIEKSIIKRIEKIIDEKGIIRDNASSELQQIRKDLIAKQSNVEKKIRQVLNTAKNSGWTQSNTEITIRNNRAVIPISATHKRKIKGFIHDKSSTGLTIFIEPTELFETNNEIKELEFAEKREIIKILKDFTDFLRPFIFDLENSYHFLGLIDFIQAKAKLSLKIGAVKPIITNKPYINWIDAKHPLLYLSHKSQNKKIEPLTISLDAQKRILIISGPNAGGKSVCLKTVGLLQYMLQCGLLVPMKELSETGIFNKIFIDIGDEQSLENDLSTYSSHLLNIKYFLDNSDDKTLFLIDEFGTGTEPRLGGAIAEACLEKLNSKNALGIVTTHYSNLKLLPEKENGIINGAMLFDLKKLQPLYKLKLGKPGSSFTFEIADKIGLSKEIIEKASEKVGKKQLDFDKQLIELEIEKNELLKKNAELKEADEFLSKIIEKYENLNKELKKSKENILTKAKQEAKEILDNSNKLIERTIKDIKEAQASKGKTKELREKIEKQKEIIKIESKPKPAQKIIIPKKLPKKKTAEPIEQTPIEIGNNVRIISQNIVGEVVEIRDEKAVIIFRNKKFSVPLKSLEKIKKTSYKKDKPFGPKNHNRNIIDGLNIKMANFKTNIDLRGKRAIEALSLIQKYIDDAILLNISEVTILHGTGNGILRNVIREYLSTIEEIKSFKDEHIERGGQGITVVKFK